MLAFLLRIDQFSGQLTNDDWLLLKLSTVEPVIYQYSFELRSGIWK